MKIITYWTVLKDGEPISDHGKRKDARYQVALEKQNDPEADYEIAVYFVNAKTKRSTGWMRLIKNENAA